jgi:hypothetical protein
MKPLPLLAEQLKLETELPMFYLTVPVHYWILVPIMHGGNRQHVAHGHFFP